MKGSFGSIAAPLGRAHHGGSRKEIVFGGTAGGAQGSLWYYYFSKSKAYLKDHEKKTVLGKARQGGGY